MLTNDMVEAISVKERSLNAENVFVIIHNGLIMTAKIISNPLTRKIAVTNWISLISRNFYDFLVDTNVYFAFISFIWSQFLSKHSFVSLVVDEFHHTFFV